MLSDRAEFRKAALIVASGFAVWSLASSAGWGWVPALVTLIVIVVQLVTDWIPAPLFVLGAGLPTVVAEAGDAGNVGYFAVIAVLIAVSATDRIDRWTQVAIVAIVLSPIALWIARVEDYVDFGPWTWTSGLALGWLFGVVVGHLQRALADLEASQAKLAASTARRERQLVARELHDLVGHSFSVVLLHLGGARTRLATDPAAAAEALAQAEAVGRRGMNDLREALALMRSEERPRPPVARLDELDGLLDRYRGAGLDVTLVAKGDVERVGSAVSIVLYEVVREALTNAAKHAATEPVAIAVDIGHDEVSVEIENPSSTRPTSDAGHGLIGMRERVESLDGTFEAGRVDGRWRVRACLPARAATSAVTS